MDNQDYKLNSSFSYLVILAVLIALGVAGRLLPHPPNFTPMAAIALFAGCGAQIDHGGAALRRVHHLQATLFLARAG